MSGGTVKGLVRNTPQPCKQAWNSSFFLLFCFFMAQKKAKARGHVFAFSISK